MDDVRFISLGDSALTIEFGTVISAQLNRSAIALSKKLEELPFPGYIESVPAYASTSIFYDLATVRSSFPEFGDAFSAVSNLVRDMLEDLNVSEAAARLVEIPVFFDAESGPDLNVVAKANGLSESAVVEIFTSRVYTVYMLGFLPGFSYMGEVDQRIATARRATPRTAVHKGSVGIAGKQTGIYSLDSPGGWQIIGRTDIETFRPDDEPPCLLSPGDRVRFVPVER